MSSDLYFDFENNFRGDSLSIKQALNSYDSLVELIIKHNKRNVFIDIGCGRGEWIEKWHTRVNKCIGLELDEGMFNICKQKQLDVSLSDPLDFLKEIEDDSVSLISMFHVIEHITHDQLILLLTECHRVLSQKGLLLMETPSIDNLLVSSKNFYLDHTHINHINPDGVIFFLDKIGYSHSEYFYIHGGPLQKSDHFKLTRVLNGIAQDVLFVSSKSLDGSTIIFNNLKTWIKSVDTSIPLLQAAEEHDLYLLNYFNDNKTNYENLYSLLNMEVKSRKTLDLKLIESREILDLQSKEIDLLKAELKYLTIVFKLARKVLLPILKAYRKLKGFILYISIKLFRNLLKIGFLNKFLLSDILLVCISFVLKYIFNIEINLNKKHLLRRLYDSKNNQQDNIFNEGLSMHHNSSISSMEYSKILRKRGN